MKYAGPRVDCDIHHTWASPAALTDYLPKRWREFMRPLGKHRPVDPPVMLHPIPHGIHTRIDALPPNNDPAGSHYETLRDQLLDPFNMARVVLGFDIGQAAGLSNIELASEMCFAANRWQIDNWLSNPDERLHGALLVPTQLPELAAEEIRRHGGHPRVSEVVMVASGLGKPFGNPIYDPIHKAAAEMNLTIGLHVGGEIYLPAMAQIVAGGLPNTRLERHNQHVQPLHHHLFSYIVHGVFDRFPALRVLVKEVGIGFFPWLIWEMDGVYDLLRQETTTVKRRPSEYFFEHVWVTTQPLEESPKPDQLIELVGTVPGFEDRLVFSSDYPHHDTDDPEYVERRIPDEWWHRVFVENPAAAYNWTVDELVAIAAKYQEATARAS